MGRVIDVARHVLAAVLLVLAMGACELVNIAPASRTLEGLGVEFQQQPAPAGFDQEATLDRIRLEYGVGVDRPPDAVTYGIHDHPYRCLG